MLTRLITSNESMLPKWVKVSKSRFVEIQSIITEAKKNKLKVNIDGKNIMANNIEGLAEYIEILGRGDIRHKKAQNRYNAIIDNDMS